ncbi:CerR family C-terminal domain-containing protein [Paraburkholderia flava]|uniref:CerR family C-terminal domain-containing protein n=1 Tax=Paraburkholderia flava TaxID=2547393 RepID=UPI0010602077|nr:CerR family C-terminal domain-containing protein [Paraburkholderia flava]
MNDAKKLRRPSEGGYARGDETRRRIIEAAVDLFGEHGFDGASTRDIAARAGVNAPALQYYFENKEGVYRACIEAFADEAWEKFGPAIEHAHEVLRTEADREALIEAFLRIQATMADKILVNAHTPGQRLFFAREQAGYEPASATQILMHRIRKPLNDVSAALVGRITGRAADDPVMLVRMLSLHGQLMIFHVAHRSALTLLGWESFDADKIALLKSTMGAQTRTLLDAWSNESKESGEGDAPVAHDETVVAQPATKTKAKSTPATRKK